MNHFQAHRSEIAAAVSALQEVGEAEPARARLPLNDRLLRFGLFELDTRTLELRREGRLIHLRHQPMQVLRMLLERSRQLVTRHKLTSELWPGHIDVDVEQGLNHCVKEVRSALGDRAEAPRYIQTLPRRGYRMLVEVSDVAPVAAVRPPQLTPGGRPLASTGLPGASGGESRVRVSITLTRAQDHSLLWAESYDGSMDDFEGIERACRSRLQGGLRVAREALGRGSSETGSGVADEAFRAGFE